jgi:hypothetical protein
VTRLEENIFLVFSVLNLFLINEDIFVDSLHSIELTSILVGYQKNLSKRPLVDDFNDLEISESRLVLSINSAETFTLSII